MARIACLPAGLLSLAPSAAAAAPAFKTAPGAEKSDEQGGGWSEYVPIDTEGAPTWLQVGLDFLANNYGYMGVAAVLLMLFMFARGSGGDKAADAGSGDDDFFEPEDAKRYRGDSR